MSTKSTLLFTPTEHWYEETAQSQYDESGKFIGFDVVIDIDRSNIVEQDIDSDGICITIKGGSELARALYKLRQLK